MRPTLALLLLVAALAVGGTLYFMLGRAPEADADPGLETNATRSSAAAQPSPGSMQAPAASSTPEVAASEGERQAIAAAPAAVPAPAAKSGTTLAGRLVDSSGGPVSGVEVRALGGEFEFFDGEGAPGRNAAQEKVLSGADGRFELLGVAPGSVRLSARAPGWAPLSKPGVGVPASGRHDLGDLVMERSVILEGRVVDSRGIGVGGARIDRASGDGVFQLDLGGEVNPTRPPLCQTEPDGSFRIDQLASGPWRFTIWSEEHPTKQENGVTQRPGEVVGGLRFVLEDGFEIAGRVSGIPGGQAGNVTVSAGPAAREGEFVIVGGEDLVLGPSRRSAKVAADGSFVVKGLRQGSYQLQARTKGSGPDAFWPRSASERVDAKTGDRGILIAWQPSSVLAFQAIDARTKAPVELFSAEARLRGGMYFAGPGTGRPKSHPEGRERIDDLRPREGNDRATLEIEAPGYRSLRRTDVLLAKGQETDLGVIELEPVPTLTVRVVDAQTRAPLGDAEVELAEASEEEGGLEVGMRVRRAISVNDDNGDVHISGDGVVRARTDAEGKAKLNSLAGKRGRLTVGKQGYAPSTGEPFAMPEDADVEQQVALDKGGSVEITLVSAAGEPVSGARIDHRPPSANGNPFGDLPGRGRNPATDAQGKVTLENLEPGLHRFRPGKGQNTGDFGGVAFSVAGMGGEEPGWTEIEIVRGTTATLVLREPEMCALTGRVREAGISLAGASLSLSRKGGGPNFEGMEDMPFASGPRAKSDGEGRYRLERIEPGSYELVVRHATRAMPARFPIEIESGTLEYDVELPLSILEGRVTDSEKRPVVGAKVWASARRSSPQGETQEVRGIAIIAGGDGEGMVYDSSAGMGATRATTDAEGRYTLRGVESDVDLEVHVDAKDAEPAKSDAVRVALGQTRSGVDVSVAPAGRIQVKIVAAGGGPVGPTMVHAEYLDTAPEGKSIEPKIEFAQGGSLTLKGLRPGNWKVWAESLGGFGGEENRTGEERVVEVKPRETTSIELPAP